MNRELAERLVEGVRKEHDDPSIKLLRFDEDSVTMTSQGEIDTLKLVRDTIMKISPAEGSKITYVDMEKGSVTIVNEKGGPVELNQEVVKRAWLSNGWCRVGDLILG